MAYATLPSITGRLIALVFLASLAGNPVHAACTAGVAAENVAESTPNGDFHAFDDGTVGHLKTGLIWKRCAEGQVWSGTQCEGQALLMNWGSALQRAVAATDAGAADWRVPNRKELESLVEFCGHSPAINLTQFPGTLVERFWTSTTFIDTLSRAWDVNFSDGYSGASSKTLHLLAVRLVRSAPPGSLLTPQSITVGAMPGLMISNTATLSATATSGLPVAFASRTPDVCTVAGNQVTGLAGGLCTVAASQAGDSTYYPAAVLTLDLSVNKQPQVISFAGSPSLSVGASAAVSASASSALPVSLASATPTVCSLVGSTVSGLAVGTCTVLADQSGNEVFSAAPIASQSFEVSTAASGGGNTDRESPDLKGYAMRLGAGWHLLGNSLNTPIDVAQHFANRRIVESVWKWLPDTQRWAFFTPQFNQQALAAYVRSRSLDLLVTINSGEGYWLKLKQAHDFGEQRGEPGAVSLTTLNEGWHLVTLGVAMTPSELNAALAVPTGNAPPEATAMPQGFVSLWSFDNEKGRWRFYSPQLEAQGPEAHKAYRDAKGFLDFDSEQVTLGKGRGFWIKK